MLRTIHQDALATVTGGFDFSPLYRKKGKSQLDAKNKAQTAIGSVMSTGISGGAGGADSGAKKK